nr:MAG TPA: hypothetical protein [Crassvirales sp.]
MIVSINTLLHISQVIWNIQRTFIQCTNTILGRKLTIKVSYKLLDSFFVSVIPVSLTIQDYIKLTFWCNITIPSYTKDILVL